MKFARCPVSYAGLFYAGKRLSLEGGPKPDRLAATAV